MAGPWEKYQTATDDAPAGPWNKYRAAPSAAGLPSGMGAATGSTESGRPQARRTRFGTYYQPKPGETEGFKGQPGNVGGPPIEGQVDPRQFSEGVGERAMLLPLARGTETGRPHFAAPGLVKGAEVGGDIMLNRRTAESLSAEEEQQLLAAGSLLSPGTLGRLPGGVARPRGAAAKAVENLRTEATTSAGKVAGEESAAAAQQEARAAAAAKAQEQLRSQPAVAAERAHAQKPAPEMEAERQRVLADLRERTRTLQSSYRDAGLNTQQAQRQVAIAERRAQDADMGVKQLEQEMLAKPTMTADEFGQRIRSITQELNDKYSGIRATQSGFKEAIEGAGDQPRVDTSRAMAVVAQQMKDIRNPSLQRVLGGMEDLLTTEGKPGLSVRAADSARGYLDSVIRSKQFGETKIDRETIYVIRQVKKALVESATGAWKPYQQALAKWRTLSRPLDIVERKGALAKVIDTDPVSSDYALSEAQVVGRAIGAARAGNPVFTRMLAENPQLKDAARLHFTLDLFGKEAVPSPASLRTWLKTNEAPLRQLGLYNEFRDLRLAREAAAKSVQEAKGASRETAAQLRQAQEVERQLAEQTKQAERLREKQKARLDRAEALAETQGKDARIISTKRTEAAGSRLAKQRAEAEGEQARRAKTADQYKQFQSEIKVARPEQVPAQTRAFMKRLRDDGKLTDAQYEQFERRIQSAENTIKDRAARVAQLKKYAKWAAGLALAGSVAYGERPRLSGLLP